MSFIRPNMFSTRRRSAVIVVVLLAVFVLVGQWYPLRDRLYTNSNSGVVYVAPKRTNDSKEDKFGDPLFGRREIINQHESDGLDLEQKKSGADEYLPSLYSDEVDVILRRLDTCLVSTNMSLYFESNGYYETAQRNARLLFGGFRRVVPKFSAPYSLPCWNTQIKVRRSKIKPEITGVVGNFTFSYKCRPETCEIILKSTKWSRKNSYMYLEQSVACLPKIFLLGFPKCGSTFLYCLIHKVLRLTVNIPGTCETVKEPHWWVMTQPRKYVQTTSPHYVPLYLLNFYGGAKLKQSDMPVVTIDASPNLMFMWPRYSENETMENYCLLPSLLPVVLPDSKYFVVMRNPVSMMYSAFWFSCTASGHRLGSVKYRGPDLFHVRVLKKIKTFKQCKREGKPLDLCMDMVAPNIFSRELPMCGRTKMDKGLYYVHVRKWLSVVPRERIRFFTLEELATQDLKDTAKVILDFLEIPLPMSDVNFNAINCNENAQHTIDYKNDPRLKMRKDTRHILEEFFKPYNRMLADLLGDDKFLWNTK